MPKTVSEVNGMDYATLKKHRPMFQKRHYVAIAEAMTDAYLNLTCDNINDFDLTIGGLANLFLSDNPNFDMAKFRSACEGTIIHGPKGYRWEEVPYA